MTGPYFIFEPYAIFNEQLVFKIRITISSTGSITRPEAVATRQFALSACACLCLVTARLPSREPPFRDRVSACGVTPLL